MENINKKINDLLNNIFENPSEINKYIDNHFNIEEINYIISNNMLDKYLEIKINVKIKTDNYIETEFGTFCIPDNRDISSDLNELSLKEFYELIDGTKFNNYNNSEKELFSKYIESIYYYYALKNKNEKFLINMQKNKVISFLLPLELICKFKPSPVNLFHYGYTNKRLKMCQDDGIDFSSNMDLMFIIEISSSNPTEGSLYIEEHMKEFKKFIYDNKSNKFAVDGFKYLEKFYNEELDDKYLTLLYKQSPVYFNYFKTYFQRIAQSISNDSPIVKLNEEKEVHLVYRKYDLYNGIPAIYTSMISDDFEVRFIKSNELVVKLYKIYFESYKGMTKEENHNLKDFVRTLLLNPNYFNSVVNNINFSLNDIEEFIMFRHSLNKEEQEKFELFFDKYKQREREKWLIIHNELVKNKDNKEKLIETLNRYNLNDSNSYKRVFNNKFMSKNYKEFILQCMNPNKIRVIDIIEMIDEMIDREITIEEILREKNIPKKIFDVIYRNSSEKNPFLYEYIKEGLSKNKKRGFVKLLRLGYAVLGSDIKSYEEYKSKFPNIEFEDLLNNLEKTELYDMLNELKETWNDYKSKTPIKR